jgi:hypothetical protein
MVLHSLQTTETFYFKHPWTGRNFTKQIDINIEIDKLENTIKNEIQNILNITDSFEFVEAGTAKKELADPIIITPYKKLYSLKTRGFYVRPINEPMPENFLNPQRTHYLECGICYSNYSSSSSETWTCGHNSVCCNNCIRTWRQTCLSNNNRTPTCPICRACF